MRVMYPPGLSPHLRLLSCPVVMSLNPPLPLQPLTYPLSLSVLSQLNFLPSVGETHTTHPTILPTTTHHTILPTTTHRNMFDTWSLVCDSTELVTTTDPHHHNSQSFVTMLGNTRQSSGSNYLLMCIMNWLRDSAALDASSI